jgi:hypothetical protein
MPWDGFHSSRRWCVNRTRKDVRRTASRLKNSSWGRQVTVSAVCANCRPADCTATATCWRMGMSLGLRNRFRLAVMTGTRNKIARIARVQAPNDGISVQPSENNTTRPVGTRLRRKLSRIFHCDRKERGFFSFSPPGPGTRGSNHDAICQSPRIQRWRRLTSAS